jgi:IclR family transcriptional regulator, pca regulon regulatory protein
MHQTTGSDDESPPKPTTEGRHEGMGGLAKGLAIIEAFAIQDVMNVADAARASGASRAAARRCLLTLNELGYVERYGREFRPLERLRRLGGATTKRDRLIRLAQPVLERARDELRESVSLAVLEGDTTLFIARAEAEHIVSTGVRVGAHLPAYCSATGRVLLSQFADKEILDRIGRKPLPARAPRTLTKPNDIVAEIRSVGEKGYAISDEELELGLRSLAVPVTGLNGEIVAAVSVSASSARVRTADLSKHFLPVLRTFAGMLVRATSGDLRPQIL